MKYVIPLFAIRHANIGGVESATYNLVRGMVEARQRVATLYSTNTTLSPDFLAWAQTNRQSVEMVSTPVHWGLRSRFAQEALCRLNSDDFVLYPNYFWPHLRRGRGGVVVHDCQYKVFPQFFSRAKRTWLDFTYRHALAHAPHVFLISNHEREMILRHFGEAAARKTKVIYNAIDWARYSEGSPSPDVAWLGRRKFLLSVSHPFPHKNVLMLLSAFEILAQKDRDLEFVLVGKRSSVIDAGVAALPADTRARVHLLGFVSDASLGFLYQSCAAFALASLYEGFGMPAVEAVGFGIPVVVSDAGALPEVTRGLSTIVSATARPGEWADAIAQALTRSIRSIGHIQDFRTFYSPRVVAERVIAASA